MGPNKESELFSKNRLSILRNIEVKSWVVKTGRVPELLSANQGIKNGE
jgi:hypothetical protein